LTRVPNLVSTFGYIRRKPHLLPKQGDQPPWVNTQNYALDKKTIQTRIGNMTSTQPKPLLPGTYTRGFIRVLFGACTIAGVMAIAIAWRVAHRPDAPALLPILGWQLLVWLPWVGYYYAVRFVVRRLGTYQDATLTGLALHVLAALLIAISHLTWFWRVSSLTSPFLGFPETRFGAYAFFFVFWFLIDLLLYWAVLARPEKDHDVHEQPASTATTERFAVRTGRSQHLIRAADIQWIEAQGYYAALHTDDGSFLLRRSLTRLEDELDPDDFIRIHRSTIVNVKEVRSLKTSGSGSCSVMLANGTCRSASRSGQRKLRSVLPTAS